MALPNPGYNFKDLLVHDIIDQAYLYLGITGAEQDVKKAKIALFALNEILARWINKGVLQYNELVIPVPLQNNVSTYALTSNIYDIYDVTVASMARHREGTPFSSSGVAQNAFDDSFTTSCVQTSENGYIGMQFTEDIKPVINYVGVLSAVNTTYELTVEGSNDNSNWDELYVSTRNTEFKAKRDKSGIIWFDLLTQAPYEYLRIRETGGATLNITEVYFQSYINSRYIKGIGRSDYMQLSNKQTPGMPSQYSMEKNNDVITLTLYAVPSGIGDDDSYSAARTYYPYNYLLCRGVSLTHSVNYLKDRININSRFISALRTALTAQLSLIFQPEKAQAFMLEAENTFKLALQNDNDLGGFKFHMRSYRA
jgi:hypothetical protein